MKLNIYLFSLLITITTLSRIYAKDIITETELRTCISSLSANNTKTWYYAGDLKIPVSLGDLTDSQLENEAEFAFILQTNLSHTMQRYKDLEETKNGKILDSDLVKKLYPAYNSSIENANKYLPSTLISSILFREWLYYTQLSEIAKLENPQIVFLAGGGAVGKSTVIEKLKLDLLEKANLIVDGTQRDLELSCKNIQAALLCNLEVSIIYVFRPIELALKGMIERAISTGRGWPLTAFADAHYQIQQNIFEMKRRFGNKIEVIAIDNSGESTEDAIFIADGLSYIRNKIQYDSKEEVRSRALQAYAEINREDLPEKLRLFFEKNNQNVYDKDIKKQFRLNKIINRFIDYCYELFIYSVFPEYKDEEKKCQ